MKRTALALTFILALLISAAAGTQFVNLGSANPEPSTQQGAGGELSIWMSSPKNQTYITNPVNFTVHVSYHFIVFNIHYSVDGGPWEYLYDLYNPPSGGYGVTKSISLNLPSGSHTITAKAQGLGITVCNNVTFAVDLISPYLILASPENKTYNAANIPLNFNVPEFTSVSYSLDGQPKQAVSGNSTLKGLSDGAHGVMVYAMDTFGNIIFSDTSYFTIDTVAPRISILSPENITYNQNDLSLNFTVSESSLQISYVLDGQENVTIAGNITLSGLSEGEHNVTVYAQDNAGNFGASETSHFSVKAPFPTTLVIAALIASVAVVGAGLLVYFVKFKKQQRKQSPSEQHKG